MVGTVFLLVFNIAVCFSYFRYYDILRNAGTYVMVKSLRRNFEVWTLTLIIQPTLRSILARAVRALIAVA